jgi:hypothetical protein
MVEGRVRIPFADGPVLTALFPISSTILENLRKLQPTQLPDLEFMNRETTMLLEVVK